MIFDWLFLWFVGKDGSLASSAGIFWWTSAFRSNNRQVGFKLGRDYTSGDSKRRVVTVVSAGQLRFDSLTYCGRSCLMRQGSWCPSNTLPERLRRSCCKDLNKNLLQVGVSQLQSTTQESKSQLRTVPTFVIMHAFCASLLSRVS